MHVREQSDLCSYCSQYFPPDGARNMSPDQSALRGQSDLSPCSQYFPPDKLYHSGKECER